mmetsp:Transcript_6574/g.12140  ORF Transcript_6574/g.12140 Transcript_6574/m.12140 type:complete len:124 (-) Transcript_6574:140-511(-)
MVLYWLMYCPSSVTHFSIFRCDIPWHSAADKVDEHKAAFVDMRGMVVPEELLGGYASSDDEESDDTEGSNGEVDYPDEDWDSPRKYRDHGNDSSSSDLVTDQIWIDPKPTSVTLKDLRMSFRK